LNLLVEDALQRVRAAAAAASAAQSAENVARLNSAVAQLWRAVYRAPEPQAPVEQLGLFDNNVPSGHYQSAQGSTPTERRPMVRRA